VKKRLVAFLLISVMALSFAVPAIANPAVATEPVNATVEQEIVPFTEMTRMYWRIYNGNLQWRQWSITNGRWLTNWTDL